MKKHDRNLNIILYSFWIAVVALIASVLSVTFDVKLLGLKAMFISAGCVAFLLIAFCLYLHYILEYEYKEKHE